MPRNPSRKTEPNTDKAVKAINLALQGGGSHGAFTWGVLDALPGGGAGPAGRLDLRPAAAG